MLGVVKKIWIKQNKTMYWYNGWRSSTCVRGYKKEDEAVTVSVNDKNYIKNQISYFLIIFKLKKKKVPKKVGLVIGFELNKKWKVNTWTEIILSYFRSKSATQTDLLKAVSHSISLLSSVFLSKVIRIIISLHKNQQVKQKAVESSQRVITRLTHNFSQR